MHVNNIKHISIKHYLNNRGIYPTKEYSGYGMYKSPFRDERTPSLKVDYNRNLWYDFGNDEGGSIIDLVMKMDRCSFSQAIESLNRLNSTNVQTYSRSDEQTSFSFHRNSAIILVEDKLLEHPRLLKYLKNRKIDPDIAREHCREIHYKVGENTYYAIGFYNNVGGYELRNPSFKGCIAPKDITHIRQEGRKENCFVFEGFMDYLSLLTIRKQLYPGYPGVNRQDYIILNSTTNLHKALPLLSDYEHVHSFLDNDKAGITVFRELQKELGTRARDSSRLYTGYKDLNEYLLAGEHLKYKLSPKKPIKKPKRGFSI